MRSNYNTKQKDIVKQFLLSHPDSSFTAAEIYDAVGSGVGKTTVYRALSALEADGLCARYPAESSGSDTYQYLDGHDCHSHIHFKCTKCGRVGHLDCSFMDEMRGHIEGGHGFVIDNERTVIYGTCISCRDEDKG